MKKLHQNDFNGEVLHFGAVRMRVTGSGVLRSTLYSLDAVNSSALPNLTMASSNRVEPTMLANFEEQRAQLQITTTGINEIFNISKIVIYVAPVLAEYPA